MSKTIPYPGKVTVTVSRNGVEINSCELEVRIVGNLDQEKLIYNNSSYHPLIRSASFEVNGIEDEYHSQISTFKYDLNNPVIKTIMNFIPRNDDGYFVFDSKYEYDRIIERCKESLNANYQRHPIPRNNEDDKIIEMYKKSLNANYQIVRAGPKRRHQRQRKHITGHKR